MIGNSRLDKMTRAVKLVSASVLEYKLRGYLLMSGIEVSVVSLRLCHSVDKLVTEFYVLLRTFAILCVKIGYRLYPFCNVGIEKYMRLLAVF